MVLSSHAGVLLEILAPMTNNDVLNQLRYEWAGLGRSTASFTTWEVIAERHQLQYLHVDNFAELLLALEPRGGLSVEQRSLIVQILLIEASDKFVHRALLQTLLPGLVSTCRQLQFGRGIICRPTDVINEAITLLSELLHDWAGQSRTYAAPDILSALRGRLRRWLLKEKELLRRCAGEIPETTVAPEQSPLLTRLELLRRDPQHQHLAELTYARVFRDVSLYELAKAEHVAPATLQRTLQQFASQHLL